MQAVEELNMVKKETGLTICEAPAVEGPKTEQHRRDELLFHETRRSIMNRLKSFAGEFERLAETAKQGVQAERFKVAVQDIANDYPLTAADFSRHINFPGWLRREARRFEQLATTPAQKAMAASFREFAKDVSSPAVKDAFQRPLVNHLVEDIKAWMAGSSDGVPFAQLSHEGKRELLGVGIDWTDYINRGLAIETKETWMGIGAIIDNAIAGKPSDQWIPGAQNPGQAAVTGQKGDIRTVLDALRKPGLHQQDQQRQYRPKGRDIEMDR